MAKYSAADRRHLMETAKRQGIKIERGESAESIDNKISDRFREDYAAILDSPTTRTTPER
jgi:hypothetical protein